MRFVCSTVNSILCTNLLFDVSPPFILCGITWSYPSAGESKLEVSSNIVLTFLISCRSLLFVIILIEFCPSDWLVVYWLNQFLDERSGWQTEVPSWLTLLCYFLSHLVENGSHVLLDCFCGKKVDDLRWVLLRSSNVELGFHGLLFAVFFPSHWELLACSPWLLLGKTKWPQMSSASQLKYGVRLSWLTLLRYFLTEDGFFSHRI